MKEPGFEDGRPKEEPKSPRTSSCSLPTFPYPIANQVPKGTELLLINLPKERIIATALPAAIKNYCRDGSSSTATLCGSTAIPSGSTMRTSGSTAPAVLLAFCLLAVVSQRGTTALAVVQLLGAVVPLCAGCEHNSWIFPHL